MSDNNNVKFGVMIDKQPSDWWSFGMCLSHIMNETYLYISFFKWSIAIGFLNMDKD